MTPLPKRKLSRMRQGTRRATHKLPPIVLQNCPKCGAKKQFHKECPSCHQYKK